MTLYEISGQYQQLLDLSDEIPDEALRDTLESIDAEFDEKADEIACAIKDLNGDAVKLDAEIKRLTERKKAAERRAEWLERYLYEQMQRTHRIKIHTPRNVLTIRKTPVSVQLKPEFMQWASENGRTDLLKFYAPQPAKAAIKAALQDGENIPANLVQGEGLVIR